MLDDLRNLFGDLLSSGTKNAHIALTEAEVQIMSRKVSDLLSKLEEASLALIDKDLVIADLRTQLSSLSLEKHQLEQKCEKLGSAHNQLPNNPSLIEQVALGFLQGRLAGATSAEITSNSDFRDADMVIVLTDFIAWGICEQSEATYRLTPKGRDYARRIFS